jgi:hypothetical protein
VVILRGCVPTYHLKQIAQAVLLTNRVFRNIVNLIEVSEDSRSALRPDGGRPQ